MLSSTGSTGQRLSFGYDTLLVPLQPSGTNNAIFLVPGGLAHRPDLAMEEAQFFPFVRLIHTLGGDQPVYGLRRLGVGGILRSYRSVEHLAARYAEAVLSLQPHAPHLLVGHCVGGIFAYEIARQLSAHSSDVAVMLLDTRFPGMAYKNSIATLVDNKERAWARSHALAGKVRKNWNQLVSMDGTVLDRCHYIIKKSLSFLRFRMSKEYKAWKIFTHEHRLFLDLISNYEPPPYDGKLWLVVTDEMYKVGFENPWERVAVNGLETHRIPGRHESFLYERACVLSRITKDFVQLY